MPFLNKVARSPSSRIVLVRLPAGTVWRGSGDLSISSGLSITLQGCGQDGAGNTTLDLQQQNLNLGAMLGDTGRMEFSGIHLTNVRCAVARLCTLQRTPLCDAAVCAGLFGIPLSHRQNAVDACALAWLVLGLFLDRLFLVALRRLCASSDRTHTRVCNLAWSYKGLRADTRACTCTPPMPVRMPLTTFGHVCNTSSTIALPLLSTLFVRCTPLPL